LTATQPRPPVSPTSSSNRITPCAYRQPDWRASFAFRLPGALAVGIPKTAISAKERRCTRTGSEVIAGLAGRLTAHRDALSPTAAGADEQDNGRPPPPRSESRRGLGAHAVPDLTVCSAGEAAILGLSAIGPTGAATAGLSGRRGKHVSPLA
jgi:hypothetical protein